MELCIVPAREQLVSECVSSQCGEGGDGLVSMGREVMGWSVWEGR